MSPAPAGTARRRIGITLGDPRGIGPEVTIKALTDREIVGAAEFLLIGPDGLVPPGFVLDSVGDWGGGDEVSAGRLAGLAIKRGVGIYLQGCRFAHLKSPSQG